MFIELTDSAINQLKQYIHQPADRIKLVYDSEGCGCAVSGVAAVWITDQEDDDDVRAETNAADLPLYHLRRQEVFFEDKLRLDYREDRRAFRLSSDNQIYGTNLQPINRRVSSQAPSAAAR